MRLSDVITAEEFGEFARNAEPEKPPRSLREDMEGWLAVATKLSLALEEAVGVPKEITKPAIMATFASLDAAIEDKHKKQSRDRISKNFQKGARNMNLTDLITAEDLKREALREDNPDFDVEVAENDERLADFKKVTDDLCARLPDLALLNPLAYAQACAQGIVFFIDRALRMKGETAQAAAQK